MECHAEVIWLTVHSMLNNFIATSDEDECTEGVNECDQQCSNTIGSYTCSCNSSTTLNPDGFRCDGTKYMYIASFLSNLAIMSLAMWPIYLEE